MKIAALKTADGRWIARRLLLARTFRERLLGLLQFKALDVDEALLLSPGASIHTFGMPYPIDAVFLSGQMKILRLATRIVPWRMRLAPAKTKHVLELPAGRARALGLQANTYVCVEHDVPPAPLERRKQSCRDGTRSPCRSACGIEWRFSLHTLCRRSGHRAYATSAPVRSRERTNGDATHV